MGSPSLLVWHPPPKPDHSVFPAVGPEINAPVDLLKIANEVFTHCTYCVAPTVPSVSGGAPVTEKPYCALPRPSKLVPTMGVNGTMVCCRMGSSSSWLSPGGSGMRRIGSASRCSGEGAGA